MRNLDRGNLRIPALTVGQRERTDRQPLLQKGDAGRQAHTKALLQDLPNQTIFAPHDCGRQAVTSAVENKNEAKDSQ